MLTAVCFSYFLRITKSHIAPTFGGICCFLSPILWMMFYCHVHSDPPSHAMSISEARLGRVFEGALSYANRRGFLWIRADCGTVLHWFWVQGEWTGGIRHMFLACSVMCHFWVCRLVQAVSPGKICESGLCLKAALCLGKHWEQPIDRLFELRLNIGCWCCFYGTLNIHNRFGSEKNIGDRVRSLIMSLTSYEIHSLSHSFLNV